MNKALKLAQLIMSKMANTDRALEEPVLRSVYADNGAHAYWTLLDRETGEKLWSEDPTECEAMGYPVNPTQKELNLSTQLAKANSDKERLGELLKHELSNYEEAIEITTRNEEQNPGTFFNSIGLKAQANKITECLTDCGITL